MRTAILSFIIGIPLFLLTGCTSQSNDQELTIAAAASLTDVLKEAAPIYEEEHDIKLNISFASSGKLARQIKQGAPVDVYLSADPKWLDMLEESNMIDHETRTAYASNRLVLITQENNSTSQTYENLKKLTESEQLAIGNPDSVPAGTYTKQALKKIQAWETVKEKTIFASDVRQVLTYVESGEVNYGMVYASDAVISEKVKVMEVVDNKLHEPIIYPGAVISKSRSKEQGESFLSFLKEERIKTTFEDYGFQPLKDGEKE